MREPFHSIETFNGFERNASYIRMKYRIHSNQIYCIIYCNIAYYILCSIFTRIVVEKKVILPYEGV